MDTLPRRPPAGERDRRRRPLATADIQTLRSLHQVRDFISSPAMLLLFDAPLAPLYFAVVFLIQPDLGFIVLASGVILIGIAWHQPACDFGPARASRCACDQSRRSMPRRWRATRRSSTPWGC